MRRVVGLSTLILVTTLVACGDAPLAGLGERSSQWINEPTIATTTTVAVTIPVIIGSESLRWFNDTIESTATEPDALRAEIFNRRGGDLIVQASRSEIVTLVPDVKFPTVAPRQAEYVTSQVVFEGDGALSNDPKIGFGLWSSEPYTRSRTVAQLAVLWVSEDQAGATEVAAGAADISCARFADRTTVECETVDFEGTPVWHMYADNGTTLVWYDGVFRYQLFGRTFVPVDVLADMAASFEPLAAVSATPG